MACLGFLCPLNGDKIPFTSDKDISLQCIRCKQRCLSIPMIAAIMRGMQDRGRNITVTRLLYCLREEHLKYQYDYYVDPRGSWAAVRGTGLHHLAEEALSHFTNAIQQLGIISEKRFGKTFTVNGNKIDITGQPDYISEVEGLLLDYKSISEKGFVYQLIYGGGDRLEHYLDQLNLYRIILPIEISQIEIAWLTASGEFRTGSEFYFTDLIDTTQELFAEKLRNKMAKDNKGDYKPYYKIIREYRRGERTLYIPQLTPMNKEELALLKRRILIRAGVLYDALYNGIMPPRCHMGLRWKCNESYCGVYHICKRFWEEDK